MSVLIGSWDGRVKGLLTCGSAIGPYATIFQIWRDGRLPINDEAEVPVWIL